MPMAMAIAPTLILAMAVLSSPAWAHNVTSILAAFPDYSLFNSYLTQTRLADEINSRVTLTCLVLPNAATSSLASKHSLAAIKNALRLLVLLDYFDPPKLRSLPSNTALATTLLQTTGTAVSDTGYVNITASPRGNISFGSSGSSGSHYSKSIREIPYNISVLEVTAPITFPGLFDAASTANSNITELLEKAGCGTFARLVRSSGVIKIFEAAMDRGLTVLAPINEAFVGPRAVDVGNVSSAELVTLLQYHALPSYVPKASLKVSAEHPIATMASGAYGGFELTVESAGDDVTLETGVARSRVVSTVLDDTPVCILTVDSLLLPEELFGEAPASAPGPATLTPAPAPGPVTVAPVAVPVPAPAADSSPAPPMESPEESPAESPDADENSSDSPAVAAAMRPVVGSIASAFMALLVVLNNCS